MVVEVKTGQRIDIKKSKRWTLEQEEAVTWQMLHFLPSLSVVMILIHFVTLL